MVFRQHVIKNFRLTTKMILAMSRNAQVITMVVMDNIFLFPPPSLSSEPPQYATS